MNLTPTHADEPEVMEGLSAANGAIAAQKASSVSGGGSM